MSVRILARRLNTNLRETRCRAHDGIIPIRAQYCLTRVQIGRENAINVPICRLCDHLETADLITAMQAEARRRVAENVALDKFTKLMAEAE